MRIEVKNYNLDLTNCSSRYAYIMLFGSETTTSKKYRIRLDFSALAETNTYNLQENGDFVQVPMNIALLEPVIDVLRNEKPVFFNWFAGTKVAILATGDEPVGEGEI